ncbi:MAG: signal peptidase I [Oscillospiraceae bacterium]|nr:signal peptidase I [Oscillospiraceae bacterium]
MAEENNKQETIEEESAAPEEENEGTPLEGTLYCWAQSLIIALATVILLFTFGIRLIGVSGPSMQNTLYTGDQLLVLNALFCDFKAGDVVVINDYNAQLSDTLVKRIVAVGGQTVDIDFARGIVYVDGEALDEHYIKEPTYSEEGLSFPVTLAEDEVFVMGDNRNHSTDSRSTLLGPVNVGYLQGKALLLIMPGETPDLGKRDWSRLGKLQG